MLKLCGVDEEEEDPPHVVYYYPPYYHKYNDPPPKDDWVPVWETKTAKGDWTCWGSYTGPEKQECKLRWTPK